MNYDPCRRKDVQRGGETEKLSSRCLGTPLGAPICVCVSLKQIVQVIGASIGSRQGQDM
jgi:hypothetical protein